LQILEEARWEFITENGYGFNKVHETKKGPVILDVYLKFMRELKLRQKIIIESQVQGDLAKIMSIKQWIKDESGKVHSEAEFKVAFFDLSERKMIMPSEEWLKAVGFNSN
jgi:acyl-CoA thioesterase FadM